MKQISVGKTEMKVLGGRAYKIKILPEKGRTKTKGLDEMKTSHERRRVRILERIRLRDRFT